MKVMTRAGKGAIGVLIAFFASLALILGVVQPAPSSASPGTGEEVEITPEVVQSGTFAALKINDTLGSGWCIDLGFPTPEQRPNLFKDATPKKLTHVAKISTDYSSRNIEEVPFEGHQRDAAINVLKNLKKAYDDQDTECADVLNVALQLILTSSIGRAAGEMTSYSPEMLAKIDSALKELAGYELYTDQVGRQLIREVSGSNIPKAKDSEYITVIAPDNYDILKGPTNQSQCIVPIDQPGLDGKPEEPSSEETTPAEPTTPVTSERPAPKSPKIGTSAEFADDATAGATVNDTVSYEDLVPGKQYTLEAELVDKADASKVLGSGSAEFTADESGKGSVVVPIKVNDDVTEPVEAAVAFETLKSDDEEAQANKAEDLPEGSVPEVIAEHKDINDEAQTVESAEDQQGKIELKKYIGTQEFAGEEKPQDQPGADGVVDAQTADSAFVAKTAGDELTVTFAVKNTGALDLKDVSVADALMESDTAGIEPGSISPEKQDIKVGETKFFTAKIAAPEAGKLHADQAKAEGTPVDESGKDVPFVDEDGKRHEPGDKVTSNEDPAHAVTPEPAKSADISLKKYIGAETEIASVEAAEGLNDSQTEDAAHEASKADEDLTVAFVVENTGELDLADVTTPSDEAILAAFKNAVDGSEAGIDAGTPQVTNIRVADFAGNADKQKLLKPGEKVVFVGDLKAPAAGDLHADKAKSTGTPVDESGEPVKYVPVDDEGKPVEAEAGTPVESQEDQAHAKTPENDLEPEIATSASVDENSKVEAFGSDEDQVVYDTVRVENPR
ncbi:VaFE repeat-containing surface-anchored protein [Corynebacterium oculi]|uniref:T-Q ester bond containing domain-containing protein n=1 Tax=Corynebacterium oculi TaxID=1544416 RepID=A0A0Q0YDS3_9CORY|nr:VaFE repeat-containing surface-anchored protein [Corynebacterium oculi]KQB84478.1 hypothetical protein Cocul_01280 [Corynebacterium oculi]